VRASIRQSLAEWYSPDAAGEIAGRILNAILEPTTNRALENQKNANDDLSRHQSRIKSEEIHA
jgi:hypothetical protein